jgi:hypothetical protein
MTADGYRPQFDFQVDLAYGKAAEAEAQAFVEALRGAAVEVKADRYRNGKMVVETQQRPAGKDWQHSGINVTTARWWAYRLAPGSFLLVEVERLRRYLRAHKAELQKVHLASGGDNPAMGFLLSPEQVKQMMTGADYDPIEAQESATVRT